MNEVLPPLAANDGTLSGMAGPTRTSGEALGGKSYIVRVRGTSYGAYDRRLMLLQPPAAIGWQFCGARVGARGQDAEFTWDLPVTSRLCPALPIRHGNLVINGGLGFTGYDPVSTLLQPANSNRYEYLVQRTNGNGRIAVGLMDRSLSSRMRRLAFGFRARSGIIAWFE